MNAETKAPERTETERWTRKKAGYFCYNWGIAELIATRTFTELMFMVDEDIVLIIVHFWFTIGG